MNYYFFKVINIGDFGWLWNTVLILPPPPLIPFPSIFQSLLQGTEIHLGPSTHGGYILLLEEASEEIRQTFNLHAHQESEVPGNQAKALA